MTLSDALTAAESQLGRPLLEDEIVMLVRFVEAGKDASELVQLLDTFDRPIIDDTEVKTYRYEPAGTEGVREI